MGQPRDYSLTFAGAGEREFQAAGRYLRILATPAAPVFVALDSGSELERSAGQSVPVPEGFSRVRVRSTVAQTVVVSVSEVDQDDKRSSVALSVSATVTPGDVVDNGGDVSVPATGAATAVAGDPDTLAVTVTSLDTNDQSAPLRVGTTGVGAASGTPIWPGDSITLATTATVRVYNPHGTTQTVAVSRVTK